MRINIGEGYLKEDEFKALLDKAENLKDVHLLCHQAGCPVYVLRDMEDKCAIFWHPMYDKEKNTINLEIIEDKGVLKYAGEVDPFVDVQELRSSMLGSHMLGDNPFEEKFCFWRKQQF